MGLESIGFEAVFRDRNFQAGLQRYMQGVNRMSDATEKGASMMTRLSSIASGALMIGLGGATAAVGAFVAAAKIGLDSTMQWGAQLDYLTDMFNMSGSTASQYATALGMVGVSVDEGASALNYFVRQLGNSQQAMSEAARTYSESVKEIEDSNIEATTAINTKWTESQKDAAAKTKQIWDEYAADRKITERDLQRQLSDMTDAFQKRFAKAEKDANKSAAKSQRDAEKDRVRSLEDLEKDRLLNLADLEKDTQRKLAKAKSEAERVLIRDEAKYRASEIEDETKQRAVQIEEQAKARKDIIEEVRQERLAEIAEERQEAEAELEEQKQRARDLAGEKIAQAKHVAEVQAQTVTDQLAKERKAFEDSTKKQIETLEKQTKKLRETLAKAESSNPLAKAIKKLGIEALDAKGNIKPLEEILPDVIDALQKIPAGAERSAVVLQLFGKSGGKFIDFLEQSAGSLKKAGENMREWGLEMSTKQVRAVEQFGFSLNELNLRLTGIKNQIGLALLPVARDMVEFINKEILPTFLKWAQENMPAIQSALRDLGKTAGEVVGLIRDQKWGELAAKFWTWAETIKTEATTKISEVATTISQYLRDNWEPTIKPAIMEWVEKFWNWISDPSTGVLITAANKLGDVMTAMSEWAKSDEAKTGFMDMGESMSDFVLNGMDSVFSDTEKTDGLIITLIESLWKSIQKVPDIFGSIGGSIATGILAGFYKKFTGEEMQAEMKMSLQRFISALWADLIEIGNLMNFPAALGKGIAETYGELWGRRNEWGQFGFANGGIVPGPIGAPRLAMVHGGEVVLPASSSSIINNYNSRGGSTVNWYGNAYGAEGLDAHILNLIDRHDRGLD